MERGPEKSWANQVIKEGNKNKHALPSGKKNFRVTFESLKTSSNSIFFKLCVLYQSTVPVSRKSSWHLIWNECSVTKTHNHDIKSNVVCIPLRWVQLALDAHCGLKLWKFVSGSQIRHFSKQKSITMKNIKRLYSDYQILYKK